MAQTLATTAPCVQGATIAAGPELIAPLLLATKFRADATKIA